MGWNSRTCLSTNLNSVVLTAVAVETDGMDKLQISPYFSLCTFFSISPSLPTPSQSSSFHWAIMLEPAWLVTAVPCYESIHLNFSIFNVEAWDRWICEKSKRSSSGNFMAVCEIIYCTFHPEFYQKAQAAKTCTATAVFLSACPHICWHIGVVNISRVGFFCLFVFKYPSIRYL